MGIVAKEEALSEVEMIVLELGLLLLSLARAGSKPSSRSWDIKNEKYDCV